MRKTLLLLTVLLTSLMTFAQTNLSRLEGTVATASGYEGDFAPANAIDGNTGTRWGSNFENNTDTEWFQIEWTSAQTFNTVKLLCEGAMNATNAPDLAFDIQTSNDGSNWTTQSQVTGKNAENNEYITVKLNEVTAKFVRFQGVTKGQYGYSFYEFEVYNIDYSNQTLGSISVPNPDKADALKTAIKVGENITIQAFDQNGLVIESGVTYSATNGNITTAGVFTPSAKGVCTITATKDDVTKIATVYAYDGDDLLLGKKGTANTGAGDVNLFTDGDWGNRGGLGAGEEGHTWVYYDLGAYYTIDIVDLKQERACGKNYTIQFSNDGTNWINAYTVTDEQGMQGDVRHYFFGSQQNTNVRFIKFDCTEPATGYGVSIYEIAAYGVKTAEIEDSEAPTAFTATLKSVAFTSAKLSLKATDNVSAITYVVSRDGADDVTFEGESGAEITAEVSGLTSNTAYTFSVVAKDIKGNATAALTVNATTLAWTAAPVPTEDEDNVYSLLSDAYTNNNGFKYAQWWDGQAKFEELTIDNNKVWHISNFVFIGSEHAEVDASKFVKLHMDVLPVGENLTLGVCPIGTDGKYVNTPELTANQWNSVDITIADLIAAGQDLTSVKQLKLTGKGGANGNGEQEFYIDNIYFYKKVLTEKTVYLNPAIWDANDAEEAYAAYVYNNDGNNWIDMAKVEDTPYYKATIPTTYTGLIFTRRQAGTDMIWDNVWNQTVDIDFAQTADNTLFTITSWNEGEGGKSTVSAGTYVEPQTFTATFKNSIGWENVYAYTYTPETLGAWPGTAMTLNNGVYTISFKAAAAPANIIFNNGNSGDGNQTADFVFENGKEYDMAAPVEHQGTKYTSGDHAIWIQANHYVAENKYELIIESDEVMEGLGGSFWTLSSGNADLRDKLVISDDKKTMTITATSTSKPAPYTPLYVMMPGEVSFGDIDYQWVEIGGAEPGELVISEPDAQGIVKVTGEITDENKDQVENRTDEMIDLSGATITASSVEITGNPNAVIVVAGTVEAAASSRRAANDATTTQTAVKGNRVVKGGDYYFPVEQLKFIDDPKNGLWTGFFISGNNAGWKYTRTLKANTYNTVVVPIGTTVPEGATAYEFSAYDNGTVTFTELEGAMAAATPYLVKVGATDVDIEIESTGDFNIVVANEKAVEKNDATFKANYKKQNMSDVYVLETGTTTATFKKAADANIGSCRAYLTGVTPAAAGSQELTIVLSGETTEIGTIKADGTIDMENTEIYDLSGRRVKNPAKGIYIVNGKKIILK